MLRAGLMIRIENTRSTSLRQTQVNWRGYKKPYPSPKKAAIELIRDVALHLRAVHMTGVFRIVVGLREMHGAAVVPEHDVSFCPFMTINKGVGRAVRIERVEKIDNGCRPGTSLALGKREHTIGRGVAGRELDAPT